LSSSEEPSTSEALSDGVSVDFKLSRFTKSIKLAIIQGQFSIFESILEEMEREKVDLKKFEAFEIEQSEFSCLAIAILENQNLMTKTLLSKGFSIEGDGFGTYGSGLHMATS